MPHPQAFLLDLGNVGHFSPMALSQSCRCLCDLWHHSSGCSGLRVLTAERAFPVVCLLWPWRALSCRASGSVHHSALRNHPPTHTSLSAVLCRLPLGGRGDSILPICLGSGGALRGRRASSTCPSTLGQSVSCLHMYSQDLCCGRHDRESKTKAATLHGN